MFYYSGQERLPFKSEFRLAHRKYTMLSSDLPLLSPQFKLIYVIYMYAFQYVSQNEHQDYQENDREVSSDIVFRLLAAGNQSSSFFLFFDCSVHVLA